MSAEIRLIIFSGLPGTGKTTLARRLARELQLPMLAIDDLVGAIPPHMLKHANPFWENIIDILLALAGSQLDAGLSVVVDSVFMGHDRPLARDLAARHQARLRAIHTLCSDEELWRERVEARRAAIPNPDVASWERIQVQRKDFEPWQPGQALFVDAVEPADANFARILAYI